jgi:hypothetical protein
MYTHGCCSKERDRNLMDDELERTGRKPENQHPRRGKGGVEAKLQTHILECWDEILALTLTVHLGIALSVLVSIGAVFLFR